MIVIGLILLGAASAAAVVLGVQNQDGLLQVHALGYTWQWHPYWLVVVGLGLAVVGAFGAAMIRAGAAYRRRLRHERRELRAENALLAGRLQDPDDSALFAGGDRANARARDTTRRRWLRRDRRSHQPA